MTLSARDWSSHAPHIVPGYKSTASRGPTKPLIPIQAGLSERTGPVFGAACVGPLDADLTRNGASDGEPFGERIVVTGQVLDQDGQPVPDTLVEIWQANASGRYVHEVDDHDAPLDPNFFGAGRCATDANGFYSFRTIKPGAYPWGNHPNAWRPAHIHLSLFGACLTSRLVTQMYFPGDPLLDLDPIFQAVPRRSQDRLVSKFSIDVTEPGIALGYLFDIVLRGSGATPAAG